MPIISYAQNFEDVMLWRALHDVQNGFYIDVGANHPVVDSVTKAFYDSGWSGINLEPMAQYHELLVVERPRDVCLQLAAGTHEGEMTFFEIEGTGLSTAFELIAEKHLDNLGYEHRQVTVQVQTLARICEDHCDGPIHFLKIDVEGGEADVISGMNLQTYRPWIMVIEAVEPMEQTLRSGAWRPEIEAQGYEFCYFDG